MYVSMCIDIFSRSFVAGLRRQLRVAPAGRGGAGHGRRAAALLRRERGRRRDALPARRDDVRRRPARPLARPPHPRYNLQGASPLVELLGRFGFTGFQ